MNKELAIKEKETETQSQMERAISLSKSSFIPAVFQNKPNECLIAIEMSQRTGFAPFAVLQNLYIVHGKPAWSTAFMIGVINSSGMFTRLNYKMTGKKGFESFGCIAYAKDLRSDETLESPEVTLAMAKAEGWVDKAGSKWRTMPELMLKYRAATMWARLYAPELLMGLQTDDEIIDVSPVVTETRNSRFDKPLLESEPQTPPPPPPAPKKEAEKDLTGDVTLFDNNCVDNCVDWLDEQMRLTLDALESPVSVEQIKELCKRNGIKYEKSLLNNEAQGLRTVLSYAK